MRSRAPEIVEPVARNLYRLMAYKDEYEVARLSLDPRWLAGIEDEFGPGARVSHRLHPPLLRAPGVRRKIAFGPWFRIVFRLLRGLRRIRGGRLDLFGHTRLRRTERALITEYREAITRVIDLAPDHPLLSELAGLPDLVRGYEEIKLASVRGYRERQAQILAGLEEPADRHLPERQSA